MSVESAFLKHYTGGEGDTPNSRKQRSKAWLHFRAGYRAAIEETLEEHRKEHGDGQEASVEGSTGHCS